MEPTLVQERLLPFRRKNRSGELSRTFREEVPALYRFSLRMLGDASEAEDAVQDAFLRLTKRGVRRDEFVSARAFVFRVVRNVCIDRLRARARRSRLFDEGGLDQDAHGEWPDVTPETDLLVSESFRRIADAMNALPAAEAEALSLVVVEGFSYAEVAAAADVPVGTVRSRLNRARQRLRRVLQEDPGRAQTDTSSPTVIGFPRKC